MGAIIGKKLGLAIAAAPLLAAVLAASPAYAVPSPGYEDLTFNVTLPGGQTINTITGLVTQTGGFGEAYYYSLPGSGSFTVSWPYATPGFTPVGAAAAAGIYTDSSSVQHLVVFGNYTPSQIGLDYSVLFPHAPSEATIINDLSTGNWNFQFSLFQSDAFTDGLFLAPPGGSFDVVEYTTGTLIGTGSLTYNGAPTPPATGVPEPISISLLGAGLLGAVALRRRKQKA